jgi:hypothetical protein
MEQPNSKFPTMGTSASRGVDAVSAKPKAGKLMKKGNTASGDLSGKKGGRAMKKITSKRAYGITTTMPAYKDPHIGPTQGNGRMLPSAINRTSVEFSDGMSDHN